MVIATALAVLLMGAAPNPTVPAKPMPKAEQARARRLEQHAANLQSAGRYLDAEKPLKEAIALWTKFRGPDDIEVLNDTMNLAVAYRRHGDAARAIPLLEKATTGLAACTDPDAPALRRKAQNNLAAAFQHAGRLQEARTTWLKLVELTAEGPVTEERARLLDNLAALTLELGDVTAAETECRRGHAAWRALRGDQDVDTAISLATLGTVELAKGDLAAAKRDLKQALGVVETLLGKEHPTVGGVLNSLGVVEWRAGNVAEARALFQRSVAIGRKHLSPSHPQVQEALEALKVIDAAPDSGRARAAPDGP